MSEVGKKFSDRPQGKARVEFTNDPRKAVGMWGFLRADDGTMVPFTRAQVNRRAKGRRRRRYG
jgi:hypothetical protein